MTYTTDCFRKIKDEDGTVRIARMVQERKVNVTITTDKATGYDYWKGARVGS
jgi:hypothetical protein